MSLQTGQALLFAPNALCVRNCSVATSALDQVEIEAEQPQHTPTSVGMLGQGYFVVRSRLRLTLDGGHSLLAVATPGMTTRLGRVSGRPTSEVELTIPETSPSPATTPSAHVPNANIIDMTTSTNEPFAPLVRYIQSTFTAPATMRLKTLARGLAKQEPRMYSNKKQVEDAVNKAAELKLLVLGGNKKRVRFLSGVEYRF